jgi:hypothetical protein
LANNLKRSYPSTAIVSPDSICADCDGWIASFIFPHYFLPCCRRPVAGGDHSVTAFFLREAP